MGKSSTKAKNKYNSKNYDRISLSVPKGEKEKIKKYAEILGDSINGFIMESINEKIDKIDKEN